jgi:hypothetical protein
MTTPSCNIAATIFAAMTAFALLFANGAAAAPPGSANAGARNVMQNTVAVDNARLPPHAKADTGVAGELGAGALGGRRLTLTLASGRTVEAQLQRTVIDPAAGHLSWVGSVNDMPGSMLVLTQYRGVITGFLTYGSETWELMPDGPGQHLLYQVDEESLPTDEPIVVPDDVEFDTTGTSDFGTGGAIFDGDTSYVHDLLVVYTPAALAAYGHATLESSVQNAVVAANQAYQNSNVAITLNLVGLQEVSYNETGSMQTSLDDLRGQSDGRMDDVHSLRDDLGADLVALLTQDGTYCGIAFSMSNESAGFASAAFSVVSPSCLSQHSLAHEIGHNQGNMHDRDSTSNSGAFDYSYGFRRCETDGSGFRTVMAYSCSGASRVTQFSNPYVDFNGNPTGIAYESDPENSAENARSMNNTADTVAAFRAPAGGDTISAPAAPSSLTAVATSNTDVAVSWADNSADETGFRLERSGNGVDFAEIATLGAGTTNFADNGLVSGATYYYRARAYNSAGNSGYSNTGSVTMPETVSAPDAPSSVAAADNGDGTATVSWVDNSSNETGFEILREKWHTKRLVWIGDTTVGSVSAGISSWVDASGEGTFRYSVRAVNDGGASAYAGPAEVQVTGGSKGGGKGKGSGKNR